MALIESESGTPIKEYREFYYVQYLPISNKYLVTEVGTDKLFEVPPQVIETLIYNEFANREVHIDLDQYNEELTE